MNKPTVSRKPECYTPETKHLLISPITRELVASGHAPIYVITKPDYDRLPLDTFMVLTEFGTGGGVPVRVARIVKPRQPENYPAKSLTLGKRLIFVCWRGGMAVKSLEVPQSQNFRHLVLPGEPGHDKLTAFKIICDTRRAWNGTPVRVDPRLLMEALGLT